MRRYLLRTSFRAIMVAALALPSTAFAQDRILPNDNRNPAGRDEAGVRVVELDVRAGRWYPEGDHGPSETVFAFGERGVALSVPGPIIRVREGTRLEVSVANDADRDLIVHGLVQRPGEDTLRVAAGGSRTVEFDAGEPGSYFYWATFSDPPADPLLPEESQLHGALIVDPAGAPDPVNDRVFVIGVWFTPEDSTGPPPIVPRDQMTINGLTWPHTERFHFTVGDTVRWRWLNPTTDGHPMHLHGFYYDVTSRGTWAVDTLYPAPDHRRVATELMFPGGTMAMEFVPTTPGNWLFHCHFGFHVSHFLSLGKVADPEDPGAPDMALHTMRGLVVGITVEDTTRPDPEPPGEARLLRLHAMEGKGSYEPISYAFVLEDEKGSEPNADSLPPIGSTLILRRGEPVRIEVVNHMRAPTAVHWHGIELERSWPDGVPNWSGRGERLAPAIAPSQTFAAEFTPPRAGTFIYHSHSNELFQIASGLYGALIVEDPERSFDPQTDRIVVIGGDGGEDNAGRINGEREPSPMTMEVGRTYRLRVVEINPDRRVFVRLKRGDEVLTWRPVAKDGADLPPHQAVLGPAEVAMGPGETIDVEFTPDAAGELTLEVPTQLEGWVVELPIHVREASGR